MTALGAGVLLAPGMRSDHVTDEKVSQAPAQSPPPAENAPPAKAFIGRVAPGGAVTAVRDAYLDWTIPAKVLAIVPTANREKATVKVRIAFAQKDSRILPDMAVKVTFLEDSAAEIARPARCAAIDRGTRD